MSEDAPKQQLQMLWPESLLDSQPVISVPEGYVIRTYQAGDEPGFYRVMDLAGFKGWNDEALKPWLLRILPEGWFMIVSPDGEIVATTMATHNPSEDHPFGGELGWVAGDPDHAGKGLGLAVCAAVTDRYLRAGYRRIYLRTDDFRLPAIKTYLKLGYVPYLFAPDMEERWRKVYEELNWPFDLEECVCLE